MRRLFRVPHPLRRAKRLVKSAAFWVCLAMVLLLVIDVRFGRSYSSRILNAIISLVSLGRY